MKNSTKKNEKSNFTNIMIDLEEFKKFINFDANHGVCGSINLGNTCYMNSSIACLSNCSELTAYFLLKEYIEDINYDNIDGTQGNLAKEWFNLLNIYWNSSETEGNPKKIKKIIGSKNKKFKGNNQQDSNEFMTVFLEILCEDLNRTSKKNI
jgi:ubiquitin carboxyl-terminal hydrolase 4/11/15